MKAENVIKFWFEEIKPEAWFKKDPEFDQNICERFMDTHRAATKGELAHWRKYPEGRLAEIIVLDQFSRNMFRDKPEAFAYDTLALILSQEAVAGKHDMDIVKEKRTFFYMPFMHSESKVIHEVGIKLFTELGVAGSLEYEKKHQAIIEKFGRYPHRNKILGRESTAEELEFLKQPDSSF